MKLNLEIDLDWLDDEMTLDDVIKSQIIDGTISKIGESVTSQVENQINSAIVEKIDSLTVGIFNDFIEKEVTISDKYGDSIESYPNMIALIKKRFDDFVLQPVDKDGRVTNNTYGDKYPRIKYIIDEQLNRFADKFTTDAVKQVSDEIKQYVHDGLTTKLGSELMKVLKVDKMLKLDMKK